MRLPKNLTKNPLTFLLVFPEHKRDCIIRLQSLPSMVGWLVPFHSTSLWIHITDTRIHSVFTLKRCRLWKYDSANLVFNAVSRLRLATNTVSLGRRLLYILLHGIFVLLSQRKARHVFCIVYVFSGNHWLTSMRIALQAYHRRHLIDGNIDVVG